jgi:hypothetical protein
VLTTVKLPNVSLAGTCTTVKPGSSWSSAVSQDAPTFGHDAGSKQVLGCAFHMSETSARMSSHQHI